MTLYPRCARCRHGKAFHTHHERATYCAMPRCGCGSYRRAWLPWRTW